MLGNTWGTKKNNSTFPFINWWYLLLISEGMHPLFVCFFYQEQPFDWPITNIFGTWSTPQHKSLNMVPSPK
jgi:hypothetical protein